MDTEKRIVLVWYIPGILLPLIIPAVQSTWMDALDRLGRSISSPGTEIVTLVGYPAETFQRVPAAVWWFICALIRLPPVDNSGSRLGGYLKCGDLAEGFARVRCLECHHEYLLAFSCRGRWFCPSCHDKKVVQFGLHLKENILYPVPHRQYSPSRKFCGPISSMTGSYWGNSVNASTRACWNSSGPRPAWRKATLVR